jgi:hypothetical protein
MKQIVEELKASELIPFIGSLVARGGNSGITDQMRDTFSTLVMASRVGFSRLNENPSTKIVMDSLKITELYAPERLGRLIRFLGAVPSTNNLQANADLFAEFYTFYAGLSWLAQIKNASVELLEAGKLASVSSENPVLELRLLDYDNTGVAVERLRQFFASMHELHTQLTILLKIGDSHLQVIYFDSGTDVYAGFQCAKAALDIMRGLFSEFWEKFKYSSLRDFDRKIDSLSKGLSFVGAVKEQVDKGAVDEETARNLTHRVLSEMTTLVGIGASLPPEDNLQTVDQRQVLIEMRGAKLLGTGRDELPQATNGSNESAKS